MKKMTYIAPVVDITAVETASIICESPGMIGFTDEAPGDDWHAD